MKGETLIDIWNLGVNNITIALELNWIPIQQIELKFNWIESKFNCKEMRCKLVEYVLKSTYEYDVEKNKPLERQFWYLFT